MKHDSDENAFSCVFIQPYDDQSEQYGTQEMPEDPIGAAAHFYKRNEVPKGPHNAENER